MLKRLPRLPSLHLLATAACLAVLILGMGACSSSGSSTTSSTSGATTSAAPGTSCGVHKIGSTQVRTFCGTGNASLTSAKTSFSLTKATCETSADYVSVNAGTVVLAFDAAAKKVRETTQYIGLNVGKLPGDSAGTAANGDGVFTGGILAVNNKGTALLTNPKTLKVTLTNNRTEGSFTGTLLAGGAVSGTFTCA